MCRNLFLILLQSEKQEKLQKIETDVDSERRREFKRKEIIEKEKLERFAQLEKWKVRNLTGNKLFDLNRPSLGGILDLQLRRIASCHPRILVKGSNIS